MEGQESSIHSKFLESIRSRFERTNSRIVLALDLDYNQHEEETEILSTAVKILESTSKYLCAVKLNFQLIIPLSLSQLRALNQKIGRLGLCSIADIKLNDIDNTNRIATDYLWNAGFSAVIVNPFVGYEGGLDIVYSRAKQLGKGVISLAFMSHRGASDGYGLTLNNGNLISDLFLERANLWGSDGVILGSTRPQVIEHARRNLSDNVKIFSPGSGAQGGDPESSLKAGADYLIYGRAIISAADPELSVRQIYEKLVDYQGKI